MPLGFLVVTAEPGNHVSIDEFQGLRPSYLYLPDAMNNNCRLVQQRTRPFTIGPLALIFDWCQIFCLGLPDSIMDRVVRY